tara:strand:- start:2176 stop:2379 length:204 start_codon:yes stop_codon:yes gene_type:complete
MKRYLIKSILNDGSISLGTHSFPDIETIKECIDIIKYKYSNIKYEIVLAPINTPYLRIKSKNYRIKR